MADAAAVTGPDATPARDPPPATGPAATPNAPPAVAQGYRPGNVLFEQQIVTALGLPPVLAGALFAAVALATYYAWKMLLGAHLTQAFIAAPAADAQRGDWIAAVWSALLGYTIAVMSIIPRRAAADTYQLLRFVDDELRENWAKHSRYSAASLRRSRVVGVISSVFGACGLTYSAWLLLAPASVREFVPGFVVGFGWYIVVVPIVLFLQGRAAFVMLNGSRVSNARLVPAVQFDILDLAPFAPLARMALRNAGAWLAGAFVISLFFLRLQMKDLAAIMILAGLSFLLAVAALVGPLMAVHRRIRARKREELHALHRAIDHDRTALLGRAADATDAAQRLQGLLAYRSAVEAAREWPLDLSVLARFGFYSVLPLLGWTAGALVDHYLNAFLGGG